MSFANWPFPTSALLQNEGIPLACDAPGKNCCRRCICEPPTDGPAGLRLTWDVCKSFSAFYFLA